VTDLVDYTRIGSATFVQAASPQPQIAWSLINGAGIDPYTGLDPFNRVVDNRWFSTATSADLDRIQHGYDRAGNRLWRKNTVAEAAGVFLDELYAYDGVYRLGRLDRGQLNGTNTGIVAGTEDFTQAWGLDATGNWATFDQADTGGPWTLTQTRASNTVNEITGISGGGWVVPAYDSAGNMVTMPQPAAPAAGFIGVYDAWNRIVSLSSGGSPLLTNAYDGLSRRALKVVNALARHFYYSAGWQSLEERVGTSAIADRQFIWGLRYIDDALLRDRGGERLYAMQDPNWNVVAICDTVGAVQERYTYAAYGEAAFRDAAFSLRATSSYDWDILYAGYRWDSDSGFIEVRYRTLHPLVGCWTSRDPFGDAADTALYEYAHDNPITIIDPFGLFCSPVPFPASPPIAPPIPWGQIAKLALQGFIRIPWAVRLAGISAVIAFIIAYLAVNLYRCLPSYRFCLRRMNGTHPRAPACIHADRNLCQAACLPQGFVFNAGANKACHALANSGKCTLPFLACLLGGTFVQPTFVCGPCAGVGCRCIPRIQNLQNFACEEQCNVVV